MLEELKKVPKKIGIKECTKAVKNDKVLKAYIAQDADERVMKEFIELCKEKNIEIIEVDTMKNLGKACEIDVGAATVVIIKH